MQRHTLATRPHATHTSHSVRRSFKDSIETAVPPEGIQIWLEKIGELDYVAVATDWEHWDAALDFIDEHLVSPDYT